MSKALVSVQIKHLNGGKKSCSYLIGVEPSVVFCCSSKSRHALLLKTFIKRGYLTYCCLLCSDLSHQ